jgi:enterochelin esterase-like enzyme
VNLRHWVYGLPSSQPSPASRAPTIWHVTLAAAEARASNTSSRSSTTAAASGARTPSTRIAPRDPFGANSVAHGDGVHGPRVDAPDPASVPKAASDGSPSRAGLRASRGQVYLPARFRPTRRYPLLVVHDGHDYLRYAALGAVLDNLIARSWRSPI